MKLPIQHESSARNTLSRKMKRTMNNFKGNGIQPSQFIPINIGRFQLPAPSSKATCGDLTGVTCWKVNGDCVCSDVLVFPPSGEPE